MHLFVKAFEEGKNHADFWEGAHTLASGLRVPSAIGDFMILNVLQESNGTAVSVTDEELLNGSKIMASHTGIFPAPEGGAILAALIKLKEQGWVQPDDRIVLFNTGTGFNYLDALGITSHTKRQIEPV